MSTPILPGLPELVQRALSEDIGAGDLTTLLTVPSHLQTTAHMASRSAGVLAGLPAAVQTFQQVDAALQITLCMQDGNHIQPGDILLRIQGCAASILTAERVALNFVQRLSGIATLTAQFVQSISASSARIADTRKTTPGLRVLEKYAVRMGGGHNHRSGLYDAVLIKDNHIAACGSITAAVQTARQGAPHTCTITVECDTLQQMEEALQAGADIILLDNMPPSMLRQAVERSKGKALLEASGGISLQTAAEIAACGVDILSVGALTHSAPALDIGLDIPLAP